MNEELLKNIWEHLSKNNLTKSDFSTWKNNVEGSDDVQLNIYSYLSDNKLTESSLDQWKENLGLKKKDEEQVLESVSKPTQEDITLDTEKVQEVTPSDSLVGEGMCPPGQVKHPQTGKCVNLSVLEVTPISGVQQPITMGEVVKYDQNEETGEIIYPKSFKGERPRCKVGFAWNGSYCQRIEEVQESFNKLSPSGKEEYLKQIDADEKTAKEMFNISFQEKAPEDLTTEEKNKYQEQESLYKEEVPKTDQELAAQKVKDRVNKSLKEELDIDLPYVIDEFITDVNYDRPPTEMLTNQLPTVGPGGEQVIYTGPSTIGEMIVNADEEKAEVALSEIYGGWGFTFEQTGLGDAIIVTSNAQEDLNRSTLKNMTSSEQQDYKLKNGISVEIDLQSFTEKGSKEEAEKLKNFIDSNYYRPELYDKDAPDEEFPKGYVESTLDDIYQAAKKGDTKQFRRIYNEDVIDAEINQLRELDKDLTNSIPQFEQDVKQYNESFNMYDQELSNFQTKLNSFNQKVESFTGLVKDGKVSEVEAQNFYAQAAKEEELLLNEQKRLLAMEQPLKDQGKSLQDQYKVIEEKKSKITAFEPKLQTIAAEQASYLATQGTIGGSLWGSFLGAIDSRNTAMASFGVDLMGMIQKNLLDEGQWESNAKVVGQDKSGNPVYETKDQYYNRIRKEVKQDIVPYIKDVYKDAFGTDVTNEYQQKFQETTFGAVTTSLSQLLAHGVTTLGNPTAIGVSFGGQIYGDLTTEMMDEKYDDMTENEKMAVAGSVALVSGILEKYGFSKLFPGAGKISQTVLTRALGRIKGKATYETIEEAIEMEVKSLPKAFFRTGNAMLIEGGVEGTQAAAEMGIKGIYNTLKEKEVFEDADILSKQGLGRIVNDAYVGALAGGSIGSVNAGIQAYRENVMDKLNRNQFESVKLFATDPKFRDIYFYQLQGEIQDKTLTPEDAKKKWADLNNMVSLFEQVNGLDLNSEQQQEAFTLLNEKQKLNKQIAGKDESLIKPQRDRIKAIDTRLSRISEDVQKEITVEIAEEVTAEAVPEVTEEVITEVTPEVTPEFTEVVIDKPAITENTTSETNRIKELDAKAEDGQTFNLDGTTYNEGGLVVPVMSINTTQEEITPEKIAEFVEQNQESIGDAGVVKVGIYKFPNSNQVSIDLNIVVPSENREVALEFGRLAGQESLFDLSTFENVKTGSDGKNPVSFTPEQFRQIASSLKENKLPGVFEQEATVKEEVTPEVTEEVVEDKPSKERVDRIVNEIIDKVKKRNFGEDTSPKVILKATKGYLQGSKLYSELTDTERNTAIRSLNEKLGIKIKKAPSIRQAIKRFETVTGRRRDKKIVVNDVAALKDQIRLEARAARGAVKAYKDISKSIREDVRKLSKKGVITPAQSSAIINKVLSTNMMNPKMVDRLTEYIDKVYKKAELAEKIKITKNKISKAKTNLQSKVGASPELQNVLDELFSIDPSLIPLDKFDSYFEIIERFGAGKAVLDLPEAGEVMSQATDIINSVETNIEEEVKDPVSKEKNKEIEDNLDGYIADIISEKINTENLYNQEGKDIADYLSKLTKEDLLSLVKEKKDGTKDYSDLEKLKLVKNNMSNGFVPKMSMDLKIKVESNRSSKEINDVTSKIKETSLLTGFSRIYGSLKGLVTGKSKMTESVRGTATFYIDDIFGNFNSKTIWNNTFGRLAKSYSKYESDLAKNVTSKLDAAEVLLSKTKIPTIQRQRNDIQRSKVKIMAYRLQREFESNPGNKQVASANSFIEETIKAMERREANSRLNKQEIKILKEIQNKFLVDGEISLDKIEKSFTNNEKKALDLIDEIGVYLEPKAVFTSSVIRGGKIKPINNYVHHSVMNKDKVEDVNNKKDRMVKPSTKAGTLRERTPGAKPINFDPISSTLSGATETLLDYHMTETVKTVNASIKKAKDQIYDNEDSSNISKEAIVALEESVDEVMSKTFSNSFVEYDPFSKTIKKLQKLGYQAALASVPRAGAELGSNMLFAISSNPQGFINGVKKYSGFAMGNEGMNAMENLGSTETMKLYDTKNMTGKMADSNVLYTGKPKASKAVSPVVEKAEYLSQFSGVKQVRKFADELSDKLISTPDKAVSRPLWFGNFSSNFKKMTGITLTEKDFIEIADGSSKYLSKEYKQAVEESTKFADQESVKMATSSNPFNVIPKNISTPDEAVYKQIYKNANSYMARFSQYEYATARNAIVSLFKAGKLTKKQALGTLIGTQMRMASYMILYSSLRSAFDRLFGFKDEEEEDYKTMIKRQLVGSPLSLLTGRGLGNVPKIAINYGLELFNEKYLEDLRDGKKYDPYKHSLVFSQISPGDKRDPYEIFLNTMTGPLSPLAKTAARTYKVYTKSKESKKAETRAKYKEELSTRMLLEGLGNLGFIPFYKDIRRMFLKDFFKDYKKEQKAKEEKKEETKKYNESMTKYIEQREKGLKIKSTTEKVIKETPIE